MSLITSFDIQIHRRLLADLDEQISSRTAALCGGVCQDFPAYRERIGELRGLNDAKAMLEEAYRQLNDPNTQHKAFK